MKTLKPRLSTTSALIAPSLSDRLGATPRTRGRKWMLRRARWLRSHPLCVKCQDAGRVAAAAEVDHIVPLWQGGPDDESNYQGLCIPCHAAKTAQEAAERATGCESGAI